MITISKRGKFLFIIGLVVSIVLSLAGLILLNVTDDGSTKEPATVIFLIAAFLLFLALIDFFKKPNDIILFDNIKNELLIDRKAKAFFPEETNVSVDSNFYVIPLKDIVSVDGNDVPEGGTAGGVLLGPLGYAATVKSINQLTITFFIESNKVVGVVKNLNNVSAAEFIIKDFLIQIKNQ